MSSPYSTPFASTSNLTSEAHLQQEQSATASLNTITPAMTHIAWTAPPLRILDPMDPSFGYTFSSSRTHESRHDERRHSVSSDVAPPPPYAEEAEIPLPEYAVRAPEPVTLAMYLFMFGFLFPPFWIFGAFILLSPLREPCTSDDNTPAWMPEKTEAERKQIIATLRAVELKWARRCLMAIVMLTMIAVSGALMAWRFLSQ